MATAILAFDGLIPRLDAPPDSRCRMFKGRATQ